MPFQEGFALKNGVMSYLSCKYIHNFHNFIIHCWERGLGSLFFFVFKGFDLLGWGCFTNFGN